MTFKMGVSEGVRECKEPGRNYCRILDAVTTGFIISPGHKGARGRISRT